MGSSRLPGKVLLPAAGKPMLDHLLSRLQAVAAIDEIVLATTVETDDDQLESWAAERGITSFRGSSSDVMGRVLGAGKATDADVILEITGDCPLLDPSIAELAVQTYLNNSADYVSNSIARTYPDGMDVQVFSLEVLERSYSMTTDALDLEHVTRHIQRNPDMFSHLNLIAPLAERWPGLGLTLDERSDYDLITSVLEHFGDVQLFGCADIVALLRRRTDLYKLNSHVVRKGSD